MSRPVYDNYNTTLCIHRFRRWFSTEYVEKKEKIRTKKTIRSGTVWFFSYVRVLACGGHTKRIINTLTRTDGERNKIQIGDFKSFRRLFFFFFWISTDRAAAPVKTAAGLLLLLRYVFYIFSGFFFFQYVGVFLFFFLI